MAQDVDEVIMLLNYFIEKAGNEEKPLGAAKATNGSSQKYVKVNNKTATGGWW